MKRRDSDPDDAVTALEANQITILGPKFPNIIFARGASSAYVLGHSLYASSSVLASNLTLPSARCEQCFATHSMLTGHVCSQIQLSPLVSDAANIRLGTYVPTTPLVLQTHNECDVVLSGGTMEVHGSALFSTGSLGNSCSANQRLPLTQGMGLLCANCGNEHHPSILGCSFTSPTSIVAPHLASTSAAPVLAYDWWGTQSDGITETHRLFTVQSTIVNFTNSAVASTPWATSVVIADQQQIGFGFGSLLQLSPNSPPPLTRRDVTQLIEREITENLLEILALRLASKILGPLPQRVEVLRGSMGVLQESHANLSEVVMRQGDQFVHESRTNESMRSGYGTLHNQMQFIFEKLPWIRDWAEPSAHDALRVEARLDERINYFEFRIWERSDGIELPLRKEYVSNEGKDKALGEFLFDLVAHGVVKRERVTIIKGTKRSDARSKFIAEARKRLGVSARFLYQQKGSEMVVLSTLPREKRRSRCKR